MRGSPQPGRRWACRRVRLPRRFRRVEGWAGRALFERHAQGVRPMADAKPVQPALAAALGAFAALMAQGASLVRIAALPAVAQLWLAPRLPALRAACPGVQVSVTALERLPESKHVPYDLALFMGEAGGHVLAEDALLRSAPRRSPRSWTGRATCRRCRVLRIRHGRVTGGAGVQSPRPGLPCPGAWRIRFTRWRWMRLWRGRGTDGPPGAAYAASGGRNAGRALRGLGPAGAGVAAIPAAALAPGQRRRAGGTGAAGLGVNTGSRQIRAFIAAISARWSCIFSMIR